MRVAAAGVNFADILQCRGEYQEKAEPPFVPGNEAAGEVCAVGEGAAAAGFRVGDRVIAVCRGGAYASELQTEMSHCLKLPPAAHEPGAGKGRHARQTCLAPASRRGGIPRPWLLAVAQPHPPQLHAARKPRAPCATVGPCGHCDRVAIGEAWCDGHG